MPLTRKWVITSKTIWCAVTFVVAMVVTEVVALSGPNVCMVQQKYNITKRVKYRAPMSIRTYEWCFSMPPRCSKWSTEMRDLTRLETEERTAEVAVCCPGYKMKDVSCVPICPPGKTGHGCSLDCPPNKWGPNCVNECPECLNGECSSTTGDCDCDDGWQGESCQVSMSTIPVPPAFMEKLLTTTKSSVKTLPTTVSTVPTTNTIKPEIPSTTTTATTTLITTNLTTAKKTETTPTSTTFLTSTTIPVNNVTKHITTMWVKTLTTDEVPKTTIANFIYNRTEPPVEGTSDKLFIEHETSTILKVPITNKTPMNPLSSPSTTSTTTTTTTKIPSYTTTSASPTTEITSTTSSITKMTTVSTTQIETTKFEYTKKPENTNRNHSTTIKFKPKEIWIKPTQKGESTFIETKIKNIYDLSTKVKGETNKNEAVSENTTPRTIIVSIIPTSVSHATFKKIALTTASYLSKKTNISLNFHNKTDQGFTKSMTSQVSTATPFTIKVLSTMNAKHLGTSKTTVLSSKINVTRKLITPTPNKIFLHTTTIDKQISKAFANTTMATSRPTNSMSSTSNGNKKLNSSTSLTTKFSTNKQSVHRKFSHDVTTVSAIITKLKKIFIKDEETNKTHHTKTNLNVTKELPKIKPKEKTIKLLHGSGEKFNFTKANVTKIINNIKITTQEPPEDETFHILTEPEHITAVMSDKDRDHTSMDLISVISVAGGVMITVITVAVVIVMIERCKRPRYDDVRKMNEMRMQVMMDNNDVPPPYVRSIFHTPLPDPPHTDKCHYQPISTLDRNLKQFMRPVVVQTISPVMLENFRGILECHYDHLPRRNHDFGTMPTRCLVSPSVQSDDELFKQRPLSAADYTIEALKCEAKLDVIDNTTSEPLYAEIPCWRPPSEHAIAVVNLNGEAITEL